MALQKETGARCQMDRANARLEIRGNQKQARHRLRSFTPTRDFRAIVYTEYRSSAKKGVLMKGFFFDCRQSMQLLK